MLPVRCAGIRGMTMTKMQKRHFVRPMKAPSLTEKRRSPHEARMARIYAEAARKAVYAEAHERPVDNLVAQQVRTFRSPTRR